MLSSEVVYDGVQSKNEEYTNSFFRIKHQRVSDVIDGFILKDSFTLNLT